MKATVERMVRIANALDGISIGCRIPYKTARNLNHLMQLFRECRKVAAEQETKLVEACGGSVDSATGEYKFSSPGDFERFCKEQAVLLNDTDTVEFDPVNLSEFVDFISMPFEALGVLDGIIIFEGA